MSTKYSFHSTHRTEEQNKQAHPCLPPTTAASASQQASCQEEGKEVCEYIHVIWNDSIYDDSIITLTHQFSFSPNL